MPAEGALHWFDDVGDMMSKLPTFAIRRITTLGSQTTLPSRMIDRLIFADGTGVNRTGRFQCTR